MPTVVHFEIPANDVEKARGFYSGLFGWKIERVASMDYWLIETSGERPIGGGLMKRQNPQQPITNYMDVSSVEEYSKKVRSLGGKVLVGKTAVPSMGYFAVCLDPDGNTFGLWEPDMNAK